jgi:hypothetical protein
MKNPLMKDSLLIKDYTGDCNFPMGKPYHIRSVPDLFPEVGYIGDD